MPFSAAARRRLPSNAKGLVTTPTVNAPTSLAHSATIGAAPDQYHRPYQQLRIPYQHLQEL